MKTTWNKLLVDVCKENNETLENIVYVYTNNGVTENIASDMDEEFDNSYGRTNGCWFTAWSEKFVYFPICYDGSEWVGSAPRNPCDVALEHQGG